jgi:2-C-methyl-D-erythritol 4-phosphate cytidylyltransferase
VSVTAVIVAGGSGERFGAPDGKQLARIAGGTVLGFSVAAFEACDAVDAIVLVAPAARLDDYAAAAKGRKIAAVVAAGETRQRSVANGLAALPPGTEIVAVHDGARPLVTAFGIAAAISALVADPALAGVVVGHPMIDTVKRVGTADVVAATLEREELWAAETPQVFRVAALTAGYERAEADHFEATDDSRLVERDGGRVMMLRGPRDNVKVTVPEDLLVVEALLRAREER